MSHLRSPRAMILPTLRGIEFPPWLAREAHSSHTAWAAMRGFISRLEERCVIGRQPSIVVVSFLGHTAQVRFGSCPADRLSALLPPLQPFEVRILGRLGSSLTLSSPTPIVIEIRRDEG